ncbi:neocarzinostatin apoprotein domain-containing protein [Actinomadura sp. KC345]|uniref:neocarzinostatin apoprotein domain-containing protein n=1 Tax=Actinomadura sp. KC345 TaxID=2530371 RepID=UPI0014047F6C|nr:neocarzinostatin apoprotein domain-containing protein [Actinomadura sp. KC345]
MIVPALAALAFASPAAAPGGDAPAIEVSKFADLSEGERITVSGTGFRPGLKSVAVGLCREGYTNGLKDCDLGGGATFVNIDGKGAFTGVTLKARPKFNAIDCMTRQCVIGAAPLPTTNPPAVVKANTAIVRVGFTGSSFKGGAVFAAPGPGTGGPSAPLWAATAVLIAGAGAGAAAVVVQRRDTPATDVRSTP